MNHGSSGRDRNARGLSYRKDFGAVVITGGGSGIGLATAFRLGKQGYRVGLISRSKEKLTRACDALRAAGIVATWHSADVRSEYALREGIAELVRSVGPLSGVVASAGVGGGNTPGSDDRWNEILETNLYGTYYTFTAAIEHLRPEGFDRVLVAVSSLLARCGVAGYTAYCASKAGILGLVRAMAVELAPRGIRVNAVCPGWVETDMSKKGIQAKADRENVSFEAAWERAMAVVPLKRMSSADEIAGVIAFLFTKEAMGFTGTALDPSNGCWMA